MSEAKSPAVLLGGVPVLGSAPATWSLTPGVAPVIRTFDLDPADVKKLMGVAGGGASGGGSGSGPAPISLIYRFGDPAAHATDVDIGKLFVIHAAPGPDPYIARVSVADLRYWFPYEHITRRYNVTRRVGVRRLAAPSTPELQPITDRIQYAPWSLKQDSDFGASAWTARDVLEDVLKEVVKRIPGGASFRIEGPFGNAVPIQNLEIDDTGDAALARVLSYLPGSQLTVTETGEIVVYPAAAENEKGVVEGMGDESDGGGHVEYIDMSRIRPSAVHVLFHREIEVRFDISENFSYSDTSTQDRNGRYMENVLPVPDFTLALSNGETVCQGTWITFDQAFAAWGNAPLISPRPLNYDLVREMFVPYNDAFSALQLTGSSAPDADWASRIAAVQEHFRRTYRINRRWMDRIFRVSPYRVAVIDPVTGTRAPAVAYSDRYYLGTQRSMLVQEMSGANLAYSVSVLGWPTDGVISDATKPAANVSVVDGDQGIIRLEYVVDPGRMFEVVGPGQIEKRGDDTPAGTQSPHPGPTANIKNGSSPIFEGVMDTDRAPYVLTGRHKAAVILSARPAAPNSDAQFTRLVRRPEDIREHLSGRATDGLSAANGPIMEVRVGPGVEVARVAWTDAKGAIIEQAFGINGGGDDGVDLNSMTVNMGDSTSGASLDAIADAVAAKVYADFSDRSQGAKTVSMRRMDRVSGWIDSIEHSVNSDGEAETSVTLNGRAPKLAMASFLPDSVRRMIFRLADSGRNA